MATAPTHEDARLLLELYDLRREKVLRRARDFIRNDLKFKSYKDFQKRYPADSKQHTYVSMALGYWDMACTLVVKGLINEELFNASNFEHVGMWFHLKPIIEGRRKEFGIADLMKSLETVATHHPAAEAISRRVQANSKGSKKAKAQAAVARAEPAPAEDDEDDE